MYLLGFNQLSVALVQSSTTLLDCVDTILVEGQRVGLVGRNGCGKSTLMQVVLQKETEEGD